MDIGLSSANVGKANKLKSQAVLSAFWIEFAEVAFDQTAEQPKYRRFRQPDCCDDLGEAQLRASVSKYGQHVDGAR